MKRSAVSFGQVSATAASATGVGRNATEIVCSTNQDDSSGGAAVRSPGTMYNVAPATSVGQISQTEASNATLASWVVRSAGVSANVSMCQKIRLSSVRCVTSTPLGIPVEPEV